MKAQDVDYVGHSYLERLQFTQEEVTDVSLKHRLLFLKLQGSTRPQTQLSFGLHIDVLKEGSSDMERNLIPQSAFKAQITAQFGSTPPIQPEYPWS